MLTTTVNNDTITPHYSCGVADQSVNLNHGSRFAEHKLVMQYDKHLAKCSTCSVLDDLIDLANHRKADHETN